MLSRFDEARAKPTFSASPSITSALLPKPRLRSCSFSCFVFASVTSRLSTTMRLPSFAFNDSAILRPSWRTFLLRLDVKTRARGPWALPPPTNIGAPAPPGAAPPLAPPLLAGPSDVAAPGGRPRGSAAVDELPGDDAVKDVGAGLEAEDLVLELNVAASLGVEGLYLDLHRLAF